MIKLPCHRINIPLTHIHAKRAKSLPLGLELERLRSDSGASLHQRSRQEPDLEELPFKRLLLMPIQIPLGTLQSSLRPLQR